ncbi:uncharacterized protein PFLUO_LOCUS2352 [Penicillium psychrofluorescens]|uniref:uncharacterized protein n=1 Tax=Penicillium psychrofluorescens TaxID=3158075 RepID=UPI003CCD7B1A
MGSAEIDWRQKVANKRETCCEAIPKEWRLSDELKSTFQYPLSENKNDFVGNETIRKSGILTEQELTITEDYTVSQLLAALSQGTLSALEVTLAFSKRAAIAQQLVSCLTETMFTQARERAQWLDEQKAQGKTVGPLHGLPVSIKDSFHVNGTQATIGMVAFLDETSTTNSPLVDLLLKLGAVIYVKTNVPQTMMTCECENNVFGRTLNPRNTLLGPGGSSGGEGALVALRGSPLGVGTDVGGSIRIPALCCGTYGFRPSTGRIPNGGTRICTTSGLKFILSCAGPLAMDMDALEIFCREVIDGQPALYDSTVIDVPWRRIASKPTLRIGVLPESLVYPLHPPVKRVLGEAARVLEAQGHEIITLDAAECHFEEINEVAWNLFGLDPNAAQLIAAAGEPFAPAILYMKQQAEALQQVQKSTLGNIEGLDRMGKLALLNTRRAGFREVWRKMWLRLNLDICLAPGAQGTAVPHDKYGLSPYTCLLNFLDYPSCIIPYGKAGEADANSTFELHSGQAAPPYDFKTLQGAPCAIQVFTPTMRDEECLEMTKTIDNCLKH